MISTPLLISATCWLNCGPVALNAFLSVPVALCSTPLVVSIMEYTLLVKFSGNLGKHLQQQQAGIIMAWSWEHACCFMTHCDSNVHNACIGYHCFE